ncbi:MAG: pyruvate ferredoxin oxidoreductase [Deltaproteobacteria bacterium]|nr:pyruvate ferredoxin oxidoreductase [Deltaproteobacteria bacterium]
MLEIRFHGRGGQGTVVASEILALAAFKEGRYPASFPSFGSERRGAPVVAYVRLDDKPIEQRTEVYTPHGLVVLDQNLILLKLAPVTEGLREKGWLLINSAKSPAEWSKILPGYKIATVDASAIAVKNGLGSKTSPIVNTAILGALAKVPGVAGIEAILDAVHETVPIKPEANVEAARESYDSMRPWV